MGLSKDPLDSLCLCFHLRKPKPQEACLAGAKSKEERQLPPEMLPERRRNVLTPAPLSSGGPPLLPSVGSPQNLGNELRRRKGRGRSESKQVNHQHKHHSESHSSKWWSLFYARAEALNPATLVLQPAKECSSWRHLCEWK